VVFEGTIAFDEHPVVFARDVITVTNLFVGKRVGVLYTTHAFLEGFQDTQEPGLDSARGRAAPTTERAVVALFPWLLHIVTAHRVLADAIHAVARGVLYAG